MYRCTTIFNKITFKKYVQKFVTTYKKSYDSTLHYKLYKTLSFLK